MIKFLLNSLVLFLLISLSFVASSWADTLVMNDGSVLIGTVLRQEKNTLKFKTTYAGTLDIKWDQVKNIQTDKVTTIMLVTDELIETRFVSNNDDGVTQIKKEGEEWRTAFKSKNVAFINPDSWRLGQGYKITGMANLSIKSQKGNTVKDELEMDGRIQFRSLKDRYTFTGTLENDNAQGTTTADNWLVNGKYDHFIDKRRYLGVVLSFERDVFTDLQLRTTIGPHIGHQFFETKALNLRTESGLVQVTEDRNDADDQDYLAINWYINYDQFFFKDLTQFYHEQRGLWDAEKTGKVTFNSWTGFRFPLKSGVVASAEVELEYDSKPNDQVDKTDATYRVKIGYQW